jgi:hypothetical protein
MCRDGVVNVLSQVIAELDARGWEVEFDVARTGIRCGRCHQVAPPGSMILDGVDRFEGPSDPADECVLFAMTAPCGHRGTLVTAYGSDAMRDAPDVIRRLGPSVTASRDRVLAANGGGTSRT